MATSVDEGKKEILAWVIELQDQISRVYDLGAGSATYSKLFRKDLDLAHWSAVEVWTPYIEKYELNSHYDQVINEDIRTAELELDANTLVFAGDVLEHMTEEDAVILVNKILAHGAHLIISIPIINWPQGIHEDNPYEVHVKEDWRHEDILRLWPVRQSHRGRVIGVYLL